ncbi:4-hydroxy-tetrahydrodipicolinate synthase [Flavimarina sp. Hel_I_48]|uniref:4-hydroxy-tetrahydrodipicolinate synthase n=1 Tax=Flavimarina sp. Hel_I_48 TaxID=1392488 RepID=UPI0004DF0834|nr:4-hydroxy-tetrahydrodipicolinate synthase [Flavimarina sp. Hel_I_48]
MQQFRGTGVALITPFKEDLSIDTLALKELVEDNIKGGVEYLVVMGTTAENATLTTAEKELVITTVLEMVNKRVPVVLGVGGNNTALLCEELKNRDLSGFDALLSVSPYYNKPTQQGIYAHYAALAEVSPLPIILYNVPGRTASNILPETVFKLAKAFDNIIGIKEAAGDMVQMMRLLKDRPKGFLVISGDDMLALPTVLAGGDGVISVLGQGFPEQFSHMMRDGLDAKIKEANEVHYKLMPLIDLIFQEGNPAGIKALLSLKGTGTSSVRLPLVKASEDLTQDIATYLKEM